MMNNLQSSAFVARTTQLLSSVARLRLLLVMLLTLTVSANAWGAEATISTFTSTSGKFGDVSYNAYKGGGTSNPAVNSSAIRLYQNSNGNTGGYIVLSVPDGYTITSATIKSTMATTTGYYIDSNPGATTPAKANFEVSDKSLSANTAYTVSGLSTQYITFACFGTSSSSRLYVSYLSVTYQSAAAQTYNVILSRNGVTETINDVEEGTALDDIDGTGDQGGCSPDWEFEGWSKTQRPAQNNTAVMDLVTTVDGAGPYYAVYSQTAEGGGGSTTVAMSSFSAVSGNVNNDANVSYEAAKGSAGTAPAIYSNVLRIYQNGGTLTITGNNGKKLTSITIGSSMATSVSYKIDGGTESSNQSIAANGKFTLSEIEASSVLFTCKGTTSSSRLYLNYLSVTYSGGSTVYYTTSPSCTTKTVVTLAPQGGTGGTTSVTATYGQPMPEITIPTRTGYDFQGYFTATSGGTKYYNADGTSAKNWDKTSATTLYAQWICETPVFDIKIKNDNPVIFSGETIELTVVGSNIAADATYQWYKGEDEIVGETTDKLTIANATADDAGNYKCEVSNATCSAENNYTVKMYHIKGLTDAAWEESFEFVKSGDKEGTFTIELAATTTYYFKLNDGSVWYWNEGTMTHNNCTDWVIEQEGADTQGKANTGITTTASGTYTFTLNYEDPSKPKLSVTYPQKKMVYLNPGNWNCPKYAVYSWDGDGNSTVLMTKIDDCADRNIYQAEIDASHSNVIFIGGTASYDVANTWTNVSYQTIDLTYPLDDKVLYEINTTHLFLVPNSNWKQSNARFAAYFYGNGETWVNMTKVTADLYKVAIPTTKTYPSVIFCRMNPSAAANNWSNKWNQSADLTITKGKNHYTVAEGAWDKGDGTWKTAGEWISFTPNYSVTFDANGHGTAPADQCIAEGGKVTTPTAPTVTGYTFGGWYKEAGCTNAWDFANDVVNSDITLYAKWTINTHTVTWKPAGGNWDGDANDIVQTYEYDELIEAPEEPVRTGYEFVEWTPAYTVGMTMPDENLEFTATWKFIPTLSWTAPSYTAALEADNDYPDLTTNPADLTGVIYSSSNLAVATIDANTGVITLVGVGETYITASFAGDGTYASAASATYTLTVVASNCRWVETDIANINSGDEVVIAMETDAIIYAMSINNDDTATPEATEITLSDLATDNGIGIDLTWYIEKDANEKLVIRPKKDITKNVYCNTSSSNDRVRVGKNHENHELYKTFEIEGNYLKNSGVYYIGVNISKKQWWGYANNRNIPGQTLKFYKRECLDSEHYWVEGNLTNVTCDPQLPQIITKDVGPITLTFKAADGYTLPTSVNVKMGSTTLTPSWNRTTGKLTINAPTGGFTDNVLVTVEAVELHTITWMVGSTFVLTEEVANATGVTQTPANPANGAIGDCADTFLGWSEKSAGSTPQGAAYYDDLCSAADMKSKHTSVTGDKTFYAVFATATTTPGTSTTENNTYSHTITSQTWSATGAQTLNNVSWTLANNGGYYGYDGTKGQQVGSGSKPAKSMTLTTSGFASASKITSVTINTSGASDTNAKVSVKVGGTSYSCNANTTPAISTTATDYKFTGNTTGEIVISWSQTSSKAIYFKSIIVEYSNTTTTPDVTTYSNYVTNCCALAPATNLTVSGTTSNTATLTWTAPSPTTGITKLQVRNADNDAVVVDDVAVGTTTATITGLTECNSYKYYVASVGDCEVFSNIVTAQPFSNAKTVNYDYNDGSGSPASFTTSCENQVITLPTATRAGYDFNGWYTAATGGTKVGDAGDTYNPTTSSITLYAQWTKKIYFISFYANGGSGTMANQQADENDKIAQLNANQFTRTGYAFVGWNTKANGTGIAYADQATDITLTGNLILYAQWAAIVTLNDAGNETTTHPTMVNGTITLPNGANACDPYEFVGWTAVAIGDWNEGINEPALVATTYTPNAPTTLYAVYKIQSEGNANAFKLSFNVSGTTYYVGSYGSSPFVKGYSTITEDDAIVFYKEKIENNTEKYWVYFYKNNQLDTEKQYLYLYNGNDINTTTTKDENKGWIIKTISDGVVQFKDITYEKYFSFTDSGNATDHSEGSQKSFNLLSAVSSTYYAIPDCDIEIKITFEPGNGDFVANIPATNPLVVTPGETITLPTCEYPGYEFLGWLKNTEQLEMSDMIADYYTGEYVVNDTRDVIFYAYYKVTPEEVEFTGLDDAELKMYHYNGVDNYYYANAFVGEHAELAGIERCYDATTWKFTNVGYMQYYIQDETGKYLGAVSDSDNDFSLSNTPKIWNFTLIDGLWRMICEDSPSRALMYMSTGKCFRNAALSNISNSAYSYVTLGICPDPGYTTRPVPTQGFTITNTVKVTSASGQKVKATSALTLETRNIELPCTFTIAAPNITFYDTNGNEVTQLTSSAASEQFELHFAYKPTAENTMEYPTITITDDEHKTYTIKNRIYARTLPTTFAIVAKVGSMWYALPSQGLNATDDLMGYPVEVDNQDDPTVVTSVPENADWSLRQVYAGQNANATKDRFKQFGYNLVFVNSAVKALNASTGSHVLTDAQYTNYYDQYPGRYEWTPTTTDLETYQLTNAERTNRKLSIDILTRFGVYAGEITNLRFLPIQGRYTQATFQVVEWKENSLVIMYNGNPAQTATIAIDGTTNIGSANLSEVNKDFAIYELPADGLVNNATKRLLITIGSEQKWLTIPYIISGEKTDAEVVASTSADIVTATDVFILKGAKFSATATSQNSQCRFRNVTVYGGGKLVIGSGTFLSMNSIILRAGGITDAGEYDYVYPQFDLQGTLTNSAGEFKYDYITDYEHWYHLVLPFDGKIKSPSIKYPVEFYGNNVSATNSGSWVVKRYDGATRATGNYEAWVDIESENADVITAGHGYVYWGAPKKVKVNGEEKRQKWGIQRIVMEKGWKAARDAEIGNKTISGLGSYANVDNNSGNVYDQGWNLIGNPYMVNLTGLNSKSLKTGKLIEELDANGNWTGGWVLDSINATLRYITVPSDHFEWYEAKRVSKDMKLVAGRAFFVQIDGTATDVMFEAANRAQLMPALLAENNNNSVDIETGIVLSNETLQDEVNFWIADGMTNDYEYNADYPKTPNNNQFNIYGVHTNGHLSWVAISPEIAAESMPIGYQVPDAGTYMLSVSEEYYSDEIDALYVTDHEMSPEVTTDLMSAPYEFSVNQAETNDKRFTVSIKLKKDSENDATGLDNININGEEIQKFIYQDKMYILHHGIIYDATGKRVITINK